MKPEYISGYILGVLSLVLLGVAYTFGVISISPRTNPNTEKKKLAQIPSSRPKPSNFSRNIELPKAPIFTHVFSDQKLNNDQSMDSVEPASSLANLVFDKKPNATPEVPSSAPITTNPSIHHGLAHYHNRRMDTIAEESTPIQSAELLNPEHPSESETSETSWSTDSSSSFPVFSSVESFTSERQAKPEQLSSPNVPKSLSTPPTPSPTPGPDRSSLPNIPIDMPINIPIGIPIDMPTNTTLLKTIFPDYAPVLQDPKTPESTARHLHLLQEYTTQSINMCTFSIQLIARVGCLLGQRGISLTRKPSPPQTPAPTRKPSRTPEVRLVSSTRTNPHTTPTVETVKRSVQILKQIGLDELDKKKQIDIVGQVRLRNAFADYLAMAKSPKKLARYTTPNNTPSTNRNTNRHTNPNTTRTQPNITIPNRTKLFKLFFTLLESIDSAMQEFKDIRKIAHTSAAEVKNYSTALKHHLLEIKEQPKYIKTHFSKSLGAPKTNTQFWFADLQAFENELQNVWSSLNTIIAYNELCL
ncbi:hypothetical protein NEDG_02029 [Nematocida displodere]|uniref:Uncharacterized protein n=1 Tax=Nematocida displodere TaxID=1805483 RepID=A0A177EEV6_9MICR|nr:hypothetical protein NEDG_02029 [Nematocida displodere]